MRRPDGTYRRLPQARPLAGRRALVRPPGRYVLRPGPGQASVARHWRLDPDRAVSGDGSAGRDNAAAGHGAGSWRPPVALALASWRPATAGRGACGSQADRQRLPRFVRRTAVRILCGCFGCCRPRRGAYSRRGTPCWQGVAHAARPVTLFTHGLQYGKALMQGRTKGSHFRMRACNKKMTAVMQLSASR